MMLFITIKPEAYSNNTTANVILLNVVLIDTRSISPMIMHFIIFICRRTFDECSTNEQNRSMVSIVHL
jgi:hypothetical protein